MGKLFEFIILSFLVIVLLVGFFVYVYVVALGNPFPIPGGRVKGATDFNYNFPEPIIVNETKDFPVSQELNKLIIEESNHNDTYTLSIPSIDTSTQVKSTNSLNTLDQEGWLVLPNSNKYEYSFFRRIFDSSKRNKNESIIICHRNFYNPRDNRSCYYVDRLEKGNYINFDGQQYTIISLTTIPTNSNYIFDPGKDASYLRIITNSGPQREPNMDTHYLVITSKKANL